MSDMNSTKITFAHDSISLTPTVAKEFNEDLVRLVGARRNGGYALNPPKPTAQVDERPEPVFSETLVLEIADNNVSMRVGGLRDSKGRPSDVKARMKRDL